MLSGQIFWCVCVSFFSFIKEKRTDLCKTYRWSVLYRRMMAHWHLLLDSGYSTTMHEGL